MKFLCIYFPNAFTSVDGINNFFKILTVNQFQVYNLSVFNRWGQKVFSTKDGFQGWDGKLNGVDQAAGAYIWVASGEYQSGRKFTEKGSVILVR